MRKKLLLVSIAASLLVLMISSVPLPADAAPDYYIEGYVADTGRMPVEGVTVSIMDGQGILSVDDTDADGFFRIGVSSNTGLTISFTAFGKTVLTCPNVLISQGSESHALNLSKASYNYSTRTYTMTGSVTDMQCAIMVASEGTIGGQVLHGTTPVKNAKVTLTPLVALQTGKGPSTHTDDRGYYEITCPIGRYILTVSNQGFNQSEPIEVVVKEGTQTVTDTLMEKSNLKKYLGLDAAHMLMFIGVIVSIVMAVAAWFISRRMDLPHGLEIIDDSTENDEDNRYL
ncbi:MAG: carboxypeptidase-like regulatory domain-containing protein [Methanomassiliicoccaceae archaeon]|nr:carboxypeptidase-like regulatory domain-containing protein [Methanomassiliicoccaceae archaeon]